jgi:hypothetical protein
MGVTVRVLRAAEDGATPRPHNAIRIAEFYGVSPLSIWPLEDAA